MAPERAGTQLYARGRLAKAEQFRAAADIVRDLADDQGSVGDAFVTLCVHSGIASADALCVHRTGSYTSGGDHTEAVGMLTRIQPEGRAWAVELTALLNIKTRAGYDHRPVSVAEQKRADRAADKLLNAAREQFEN